MTKKGDGKRLPLLHPAPQWWLDHMPCGHMVTPHDLCEYCGHIRLLHGNRCHAAHSTLFDSRPCDCTNTATGSLYRMTTRLMRTP